MFDGPPQAVGKHAGVLQIDLRQDDHELIAAETSNCISIANLGDNTLGGLNQDRVADGMQRYFGRLLFKLKLFLDCADTASDKYGNENTQHEGESANG